jgi:hypothetical protein
MEATLSKLDAGIGGARSASVHGYQIKDRPDHHMLLLIASGRTARICFIDPALIVLNERQATPAGLA